ncbi:MAG TPA: transcriptional regulator [Brochothrix thermosphacta]|jgi:DNA-binding winged helix-turn-helix (wHTH) protein|nr:transcriptional regulator [Brochothrix thermosphacta]
MHNHYIINGLIEFHPAASTLRNLDDPENVVVLNSPAGRCFLLLITRNGTIVTQQEFMNIVWEENGMLVSSNTFYQNISILRKGLKKVGLSEDPIVTIPRVGLTLASGTEITKRSSEKLVTINNENADFINENSLAHEQHYQESLPQLKDVVETGNLAVISEDPSEGKTAHTAPPANALQKKSASLSLWVMGVVATILLITIVSLNSTRDNNLHYFSQYLFLANASGCHIYIADKHATPDDRIKSLSLVEKFKASCSNYPWVYITHYFMLPRISVIRCNKPINEQNICISEYYFRGYK